MHNKGPYLNFLGECGRKHERLSLSCQGHVVFIYNAAYLILKTHIQHTVSLIEHKVSVYKATSVKINYVLVQMTIYAYFGSVSDELKQDG